MTQDAVQGTIELTADGCFALRGDRNPETLHVIVFPFGSTLDPSVPEVDIPWWGAIAVGDQISTGGGELPAGVDLEIPPRCEADNYIVLYFITGTPG
jgi:hypothetical protein